MRTMRSRVPRKLLWVVGALLLTLLLVGFVSLLITYYAVNLWIAGLHSYAK